MTNKTDVTIKKSNLLIESICKADMNEKRLIVMAASLISQNDHEWGYYIVSLPELKKLAGIKNKRFYDDMEEASKSILKKPLLLRNDSKGFEMCNWFSYVQFDREKLEITVSFHEKLKPHLLELATKFTEYLRDNVFYLKTPTNIIFYELIKSYEFLGKGGVFYREMTIEQLDVLMSFTEKGYKTIHDIKRFIIEPAKKAINLYTDIEILDIEYVKKGRKTEKMIVTAKPKNQIIIDVTSDNLDQPQDNKIEAPAYKKLLDFGISEISAKRWANKYDEARINRSLDYTEYMYQQGTVKSKCGYFSKVLADDMGQMWALEKAKNLAEQQAQKEKENDKEKEYETQREKDEQERQKAIFIFEQLSEDEQEYYLDEMSNTLKSGIEKARFKAERGTRKAHTKKPYALALQTVLKKYSLMD